MFAQLNRFQDTLIKSIAAQDARQILLAVCIMVAALLAGNLLKRRIRNASYAGLKNQVMDFVTPLIPPTLSALLFLLAVTVAETHALPPDVLRFFVKLSVAWLAVRFVMLMTSRKSAGWFIILVIAPMTMLELFDIWKPVADSLKSLKFTLGDFKLTAYTLLKGIIALIVLFWLAGLINGVVNNRIYRMQFMHYSHRTLMVKIFQILLYFIVFIIAMQMVGIDLTALSVLGGAIGVGIGFGLQKIASNFMSGIILLFERSIQVDDLVELADGTFGYVRKTAARYTLLETFDGKEVLIPNEEFITQRIITWTHSNTLARIQILVGVKYGTDLEKALQILVECASAHPRCATHEDKKPFVFISDFADSAINLNLYFWVDDVNDGRLKPKSDVMLAIWKRFEEAGIEIPFPQRVLHFESQVKPVEISNAPDA